MSTRRDFLKYAGIAIAGLSCNSAKIRSAASDNRPNFIFYITDDISFDDFGCYGNPYVKTPHIDMMAREGVVFDNCYLTTSSCSPSRCSIVTGRYPHNHGAPELHTELPHDQYMFVQALRESGYYTVLSGKNHMGSVERGFDLISPGRGPGRQEDWVEILRHRPKEKPFFFWFASKDAHRGWTIDDQSPRYALEDVYVPPYLANGPLTRKDLANYYHEVSRADRYLGLLRDELKQQGIDRNTYIIFCSDNGRPFKRCKTRLYDSGIKTPLLWWAPGRLKPARVKGLASTIDLAPTFLELAGIQKDDRIQGVSLKPMLDNPSATVRDYVFAEHNWHGFMAHERMARYKNWVYIRNVWYDRENLFTHSNIYAGVGKPGEREISSEELWDFYQKGVLHPHQSAQFQKPMPYEELFDVHADPHQFTNLAVSPSPYHQNILNQMRQILDLWIEQTGDTIPDNPTPDWKDLQGHETENWQRGVFPGAERNATQRNHPGPIRASAFGLYDCRDDK